MIKTKRGVVTLEDCKLILKNLPKFIMVTRQGGHITEALYDELGFPGDHEKNEYGVDCTVGTEHEHM
eukprot:8536718-Ditylum_brightwellii.AAC.1